MKKVKFGVFGSGRGRQLINVLSQHPDAELVAVCDQYEEGLMAVIKEAESYGEKVTPYKEFDKFIEHGFDVCILANYADEHAPFAVKCLEKGINVLSEVLAVKSLEEAEMLVKAVRNSSARYAYSENFCYFKAVREMRRLYQLGEIGEFCYGEGEYNHYIPMDTTILNWRGLTRNLDPTHWRMRCHSTFYCTHATGPILHSTGLRAVEVSAIDGTDFKRETYKRKGSDGAVVICKLSNGGIAKFLPATSYPSIFEGEWFCLYGTEGAMETDRYKDGVDRIHIAKRDVEGEKTYIPDNTPQFALDMKIWAGGHHGADFFPVQNYIETLLERGNPDLIDVYEALDMTLIGTLAQESIKTGKTIKIPDFREMKF